MRQRVDRAGSWLLGCSVILVSLLSTWGSQGWGGRLEDLLLENKQITIDQWVQLKAEEEKREAKALEASRAAGDTPVRERWYEKISIRGYTQFRYNYTLDEDLLRTDQDRSIDGTNQFFIRRARLIISGQPHERLFVYFQPSFEGLIGGVEEVGVLRDLYADLFLTHNKEWRIRAGLSKVPFGLESMQSSQVRLAFDRHDAGAMAVPGERDLGLYLYYTPTAVRERFRRLVDSGLKGSGDYGMLGIGVYNGQGINVRDQNKNKHVVFHSMYPFELPNGQIIQVGMDAYTGVYKVSVEPVISSNPFFDTNGNALATNPLLQNNGNYQDQRVAWHFVLFPQPFGLQAEYTIGRGPELNDNRSEVVTGNIRGGYVQLFYRYQCESLCVNVVPYVKAQEYFGGIKSADNAPRDSVRELELGIEYQFNQALELTIAGTFTSRDAKDPTFQPASCTNSNATGIVSCYQTPYQHLSGNLLRFQLQWNF